MQADKGRYGQIEADIVGIEADMGRYRQCNETSLITRRTQNLYNVQTYGLRPSECITECVSINYTTATR